MTTTLTPATPRHRQQLAAATLANLLTLDAPEMWAWRVNNDGTIEAHSGSTDLDATRIEFHQWAAVLDDATWHLRPHLNNKKQLALTGTHHGIRVELWNLLHIADCVDVAELSAPPQVDAPAAQPVEVGA